MPAASHAAGFWNLDKVASSYGRGGTNIADPRDPTGLYTNPASLAGVPGLQLVGDMDMIFDHRKFARAPDDLDGDGTDETYDPVSNSYIPIPSFALFASYNFASLDLDGLTVGAAVFGPLRAHVTWPKDGAQRYSQVSNYPLQVQYTLGAGYELPWYNIRLGAAIHLTSQIIDTSLALNTFLSFPETPEYDVLVQVDASEHAIPVGLFSLSGQPHPRVTLAVSLRLPYDVDGSGEATIGLGKEIGQLATVTGNKIGIQLSLPAILRLAALYRHPDDRFEIEAAFVWEGWSRNQDIVFKPKGIKMTVPAFGVDVTLTDIIIETRWRNTYSLRLGGQYRLIDERLTLRGGVYYERPAVGRDRLNPSSFDLHKVGITVGTRVELPFGFWVDFAAGYGHWLAETVDDSDTRIVDPLTTPPKQMWAIGNGEYSNFQINLMLALGLKLDL